MFLRDLGTRSPGEGKGGKRRGAVTQVVYIRELRVATIRMACYWCFQMYLSRHIISINELQIPIQYIYIYIQVGLTSLPYISQHFVLKKITS